MNANTKYPELEMNYNAKDINKKLASKRLLSLYFDPPKPDTPPVKVNIILCIICKKFYAYIYAHF